MDVKPFGRRIYIKPEEEKTLIQSDAARNTVRGTVVAIGPDCEHIKCGDTLIFTSWGVDEVNVNGEKHYFLIETDEFILARVEVQTPGLAPSVPDSGDTSGSLGGSVPAMPPAENLPDGLPGEAEQLQVPQLTPEAGSSALES